MNHLEKQFIGRERSMKLSELGFTAPCFGAYSRDGKLITQGIVDFLAHRQSFVRAILWEQARDFFEQSGYFIEVQMVDSPECWVYRVHTRGAFEPLAFICSGGEYENRIDALAAAIDAIIDLNNNRITVKSTLADL